VTRRGAAVAFVPLAMLALARPALAEDPFLRFRLEPTSATTSVVLEAAREVVGTRLEALGVDATADVFNDAIEVSGSERMDEESRAWLIDLLTAPGHAEFRAVMDEIAVNEPMWASAEPTCPIVGGVVPSTPGCADEDLRTSDVVFVALSSETRYRLGPVQLSGTQVQEALAVQESPPGWVVQIRLTTTGADAFSHLADELGRQVDPRDEVAIIVDRRVIAAPHLESQGPVANGFLTITQQPAGFHQVEAQFIAAELTGGSLPIELRAIDLSKPTVNPGDAVLPGIAFGIGIAIAGGMFVRARVRARRRRA
jgi:preprotein translocase subunit SecD